ncbi:MAG: hypothetical protein DMH00_04745, partial [Acidobacteria bacterium]
LYRQIPKEGITRGEFDRRLYTLLSLELWFRNVVSVPQRRRMEAAERLRFRGRAPGQGTFAPAGLAGGDRSLMTAGPQA